MGLTNDFLIGNANTLIVDNFRDSWTGDVANDADMYLSLCLNAGGTVTNATGAGVLIRLTSNGHGLSNGAIITVVNVGGNGAAKGTWTITVVDANNFTLNGSTGDGTYDGGGQWYPCVTDASAMALTNVADGTYTIDVDGDLGLTPNATYMLIFYCLGPYRDLYNELIRVVARISGSS